ncbi:MAG: BrnA antitoxin family protein [Pseudomonadota bacterium]
MRRNSGRQCSRRCRFREGVRARAIAVPTLRLDPDLVKALRDLGADWETQANDLLRAALADAPAAPLQRVS